MNTLKQNNKDEATQLLNELVNEYFKESRIRVWTDAKFQEVTYNLIDNGDTKKEIVIKYKNQ